MRSLVWWVSVLPGLACAGGARIESGNVVLDAADGTTRRLTSSGHDRDAELSPDGRWVAFVRDRGPAAEAEGSASEIRVVPTRGGEERVLVASDHACGANPRLHGLASPQFLTDSRHLVFESQFVATSDSVQLTSVRDGGCRFVAPANDVRVVRSGPHRDWLIVSQHRYFLAGGSYDWYWLVDLKGRVEGPVGPEESSVADYLEALDAGEG